MNWTKDKPTERGCYCVLWYYGWDHAEPTFIHIIDKQGILEVQRFGSSSTDTVGGVPVTWWFGPIEIPAPPMEKANG